MLVKKNLLIVLLTLGCRLTGSTPYHAVNAGTVMVEGKAILVVSRNFINDRRPSPLMQLFRQKQRRNRKVAASLLAFPFPFGIVGLHRIYLGCAPYIPVVYIGSLGGAFGILPFIDFCVLVLDKDIQPYMNNNQVFMWVTD